MVFPVVGGTQSTGYEIDNSLRFNDTNYLTRDNTTQSGGGTNFTFSAWLKMSTYADGGYQGILSIFKDSNDYFEIYKDNSEKLQIGQNINGTSVYYQNQDIVYRDYSAWYHLVVSFDNSASGEVNKIKTYINGEEISEGEGVTNGNPFGDVGLGDSAYDTRVGSYRDNTDPTWNGYMADVNLVAGQTLAASYFGKTDDNGEWIPKKYTGSHGDNGFFLEFQQIGTSQNSSGMGADTSGEDNHLAVTGLSSVDVTVDTPTNNFCTWNPLVVRGGSDDLVYTEGNTGVSSNQHATNNYTFGTQGFANGKWYWEVECETVGGEMHIGIVDSDSSTDGYPSTHRNYRNNGNKETNTGSAASFGNTYTDGDIIGVAVDLDNTSIYFAKNGTWQNSGNPESGASKTGAAFTDISSANFSNFVLPWVAGAGVNGGADVKAFANFGNPPFSISSGNADANGYGNFEYAVPSGYYALCTKNLAEYG